MNKFLIFVYFIISFQSLGQENIFSIVTALKKNKPFTTKEHIYARILKGKREQDFTNMSPDKKREMVFFLGLDGIKKIFHVSDKKKLQLIGYPNNYIAKLINQGYMFKIVLFKTQSKVRLATWKNISYFLKDRYKKTKNIVDKNWYLKYKKHLKALTQYYAPVKKLKMSPQNAYKKIKRNGGELWKVREYLHKKFNINTYFAGDGSTRQGAKKRLLKEYIGANLDIDSLDESMIIDLKIL